MPRKSKRPCSHPGCPNLTDGRYCPEHQQKVNSNYEKYGRDKATKKRYGRAWKRIRDKYAAEHPYSQWLQNMVHHGRERISAYLTAL